MHNKHNASMTPKAISMYDSMLHRFCHHSKALLLLLLNRSGKNGDDRNKGRPPTKKRTNGRIHMRVIWLLNKMKKKKHDGYSMSIRWVSRIFSFQLKTQNTKWWNRTHAVDCLLCGFFYLRAFLHMCSWCQK